MAKSTFLTYAVALEAIQLLESAIRDMHGDGLTKRCDLHIVVLDPLSGEIICQYSIGKKADWEHTYDQIARDKATLAFKHKKDTSQIMNAEPHLLSEGDTVHAGGVYYKGITIGVSGVESEFDEAIGRMIAALIIGMVIHEYKKTRTNQDLNNIT